MEKLEQAKRPKYIIQLTWPIFIELLLQMLVGNMDQFMVSRHSQTGVAAIGNANQIMNVILLTFSVISVATTILVSLYIGSGNRKKTREIYALSLFVNALLSIVISVLLLLFSTKLYELMNLPKEAMQEANAYIRIVGGFLIFQAIYLTFTAIFRSNALMKETMFISIVINLLNIGGNAVLINGLFGFPALGVMGAAISSCISRFVGCVIIIYLFYKRLGIGVSLKDLKPFPKDQLKKLLGIGLPSGGETLSYNLSQVCIQTLVNRFGTVVITTKIFSTMFAMVTYLYAQAISQAAQIVVGYLMGAGDLKTTDKQVKSTLFIAMASSIFIALMMYIFAKPIFGLFTDNAEVIELGKRIMFIELFLETGRPVNIVMVRSLQAVGDIRFPIVTGIICMWSIAVGGGYFLGVVCNLGLPGFWIAMTADECIRAMIFLFRWHSGAWKNKNLIGTEVKGS